MSKILWRSLLATLMAATLLLAACGGDDAEESAAEPAATAEAGPWTFTDDRGEEISLESPPERIVAYETAGAALWYLGTEPVGIFGSGSLPDNPLLEGVDVSGIESLGEVYGEINLEALAALRPDLIVTAYNPDIEPLFGFADTAQQEKVEALAPIVAIDGTKDPTDVIGRFEDLAGSLGADLEAPELVEARERFDRAVEGLKAATADKPGLTALGVGGYGDQLYFAKPAGFPALAEYKGWGLDLVEPTGGDDVFWEIVSFERADKYPADLILHDTRTGALGLDALAKRPTWAALPAVEAGQLVEWQGQEDWVYDLYAADIEKLTAAVESADPDLVGP